jgi:K+-sensing histidine kinase KdpD
MIGTFWNSPGNGAKQFALGIVGLALITFTAVLLHLQPGAISLLYLIVVVFVSLRAGFVSSVAVSVVAVVCLHYYFLPLFSSSGTKNPLAIVAAICFLDHRLGDYRDGGPSAEIDGSPAQLAI